MKRLLDQLRRRDCTHLAVGAMSKNCVDAVIELAQEHDAPLILIASRRQVECIELGGGYANNWDTFSFADYVRSRDPEGVVTLARDHGGPWQHPEEATMFPSADDAMESAKLSFLRDIEAGFQILHIDPVFDLGGCALPGDIVNAKLANLYGYCMDVAQGFGHEVLIEIGSEEQQPQPLEDPANLLRTLDEIVDFCEARGYRRPTFVVVQTGTKVMARKNVGVFPSSAAEIPRYVEKHRLNELVQICEARGVLIKQHNTDYLTNDSLRFHPVIGIHAANVAPEFGVAETTELLSLFHQEGMAEATAMFINICVASKKWQKWKIPGESLSPKEKALICGHYVFMDERVIELKRELNTKLSKHGKQLDMSLKQAIKTSISRYMNCFNLISTK